MSTASARPRRKQGACRDGALRGAGAGARSLFVGPAQMDPAFPGSLVLIGITRMRPRLAH
jgi:hypothetical protein